MHFEPDRSHLGYFSLPQRARARARSARIAETRREGEPAGDGFRVEGQKRGGRRGRTRRTASMWDLQSIFLLFFPLREHRAGGRVQETRQPSVRTRP